MEHGLVTFLTAAGGIIASLGGWELVKHLLHKRSNDRMVEAEAFKTQQAALMEDYNRMKEEVRELNKKVDDLYDKIHTLESERLDLLSENNELRLALKEAEKHVCYQPDDRCLQRLNPDDHCRLRKLLRGEYGKDHPGAILTEEDMMRSNKPLNENENDNKQATTARHPEQ